MRVARALMDAVLDASAGAAASPPPPGGSGGGFTTTEADAFYGLAAGYGVVALVALVQLLRIQARVPEYGWTTQKVFHMLNFLVAGVRCGVFLFRESVDALQPGVLGKVLLDIPGMLFFTTYTLLVLFWAEIYHQARSMPTGALRPTFAASNALVYMAQAGIWVYMGVVQRSEHSHYELMAKVSACFLAVVSVIAALGFALYGGRLFLMLRRFPIESKGRRKKLREVGCVTAVCSTCFTARAVLDAYQAFYKTASLDVMDHAVLNAIYYAAVELIPSALVLFILRKLPPKRPAGYQAIQS